MAIRLMILLMALYPSPSRAEWCYTEEACGPPTWASLGSCNGSSQSPIDIPESSAHYNSSLGSFQFIGYNDSSKLLTLNNTGHTVEGAVAAGVSVSAGGLPDLYTAVAFHFHWGNASLGSEHRLSGKQFPMEMHIVHIKAGMNLSEAKQDPTGIAVLGFFIDVMESANASRLAALSDLLVQISTPGSPVPLNASLSLDDLLSGVNRSEYYRYPGSLTTPTCDQAVVWTVFSNPIYVPSRVVQAFQTAVKHSASGSLEALVNNFRPPQPLGNRQVQVSFTSTAPSPGASTAPSPGASTAPSPGASTAPSPGASTAPSPGASTAPSPGASTAPSPGASTAPSPGASTAPSSGTNTSTATVTKVSSAGRVVQPTTILFTALSLLMLSLGV